jgi:hypothetical protein
MTMLYKSGIDLTEIYELSQSGAILAAEAVSRIQEELKQAPAYQDSDFNHAVNALGDYQVRFAAEPRGGDICLIQKHINTIRELGKKNQRVLICRIDG